VRDEGLLRLGKPIDNSGVVREVDPRSRREIVCSSCSWRPRRRPSLYAWPPRSVAPGRPGRSSTEKGAPREEPQAAPEKASASLRRVETIAAARASPTPDRSIVIEVEAARAGGEGRGRETSAARNADGNAENAALNARPPLVPPTLAGEGPTAREKKTHLRLMLLALTISL
jgi:hypothetical protein